jgi:Mn2+/Fe2+ NRAMP family transporter
MKWIESIRSSRVLRSSLAKRLILFLSVFGPATITAMADNDAGGVATYSVAGSRLGYPILFLLLILTVLLAVTQEMGMRLTVITGKGLADLIRERFGVRTSLIVFLGLFIANMGSITTNMAAVKTTSNMFNIPPILGVIVIVIGSFIFVTRGNYKATQNLMLIASLFFLSYVIAAFAARPDWGEALSNLVYPHGVTFDRAYLKDYLIIGMGVLGTTITPWGQFFISSFSFDKKIDKGKVSFARVETMWGAFLTNFFSFFMIVATAAALFANGIVLESGEQAALAIEPFAGRAAGVLFGVGILNAGFMGLVIISLSTAYAFAEFFGLSGSLDDSFSKSKVFYILYFSQLTFAAGLALIPGVSLFRIAIVTQILNAMILPAILFYLIRMTSDRQLMGEYANSAFQRRFAWLATGVIAAASLFTAAVLIFQN